MKRSIVLLHGWGQSHTFWSVLQTNLQKNFQILTPDLPGWGSIKEPPYAWSTSDYATFVHSLVLKSNLKDPVIVGHSFGGRIATAYALKYHPKKLVLYSSPATSLSSVPRKLHVAFLSVLKHFIPNTIYKLHSSALKFPTYDNHLIVTTDRSKRMIDVYIENSKRQSLDYSRLSSDTLLLYGKKDRLVPIRVARSLQAKIHKAKLVEFDSSAHFAHIEESEKFCKTLKSFI